MSCIQYNVFVPSVKLRVPYRRLSQRFYLHPTIFNVSAIRKEENHNAFPRLVCSPSRYRKIDLICMAGGKGSLESQNEDFSWNPLKFMEGMRQEQSVQNLLREQMQEREFGGNGGGGPPWGGGPLGGGGGGGDSEDQSFAGNMDELLQVVLATICFMFVCIYLFRGAELRLLARDYITYLFGGNASMRLQRAMDKWGEFNESMIRNEEIVKDWLKRVTVATHAWWHKPGKLV